MLVDFLKTTIQRHLEETKLYFEKLQEMSGVTLEELMKQDTIKPDSILLKIPAEGARPLGEIILHIIRSLEFYIIGIMTNKWEALPYTLTDFNTIPEIVNLFDNTMRIFKGYLERISLEKLNEIVTDFNRPATKAELLLEMIEHSIHHRGQLSVYFRLLDIEPPKIPYII